MLSITKQSAFFVICTTLTALRAKKETQCQTTLSLQSQPWQKKHDQSQDWHGAAANPKQGCVLLQCSAHTANSICAAKCHAACHELMRRCLFAASVDTTREHWWDPFSLHDWETWNSKFEVVGGCKNDMHLFWLTAKIPKQSWEESRSFHCCFLLHKEGCQNGPDDEKNTPLCTTPPPPPF